MKNSLRYSFSLLLFLLPCLLLAQVDTSVLKPPADSNARHRVAIFLPLYLDSAFDAAGTYRYDKIFPKFINPGLEFYEGAQLALDSMRKEGTRLDIHVYDTRSQLQPVSQVLAGADFPGTELILAQVINAGEEQQFATAALQLHIPFINVNYPNDAGIRGNPDLVILNSTLRAHVEAIYRFLQRNYPTKPLIYFGRRGAQEDRLKGYFTDLDRTTAGVPLQIRYETLDDNPDAGQLAASLDSSTQEVVIAGSLDQAWGARLAAMVASMKSYRTVLIGMPTWDGLDYSRPELAGEEIVYTTPFYNNPADSLVRQINQYYKGKFFSRPSDMVFRGFESVYRFGHLLACHGKDLGDNIGEKKFKVFNDFNIEPVFLNRQTMQLDYFENKKLYFIHIMDGNVTAVN
ncbi:MAG TPA: hypothetical protein VN616_03120 [Puia sp.]|nr:hypothetical protein [Puia sp.]